MKLWLKQLLETYFPAVKYLTTADQTEAEQWANWMKDQWASRGLVTLSQQRVPMTETRNAIREEFGEDHIALVTMNFTEQQWRTMNGSIIDRVQHRNEQVQIIEDPEAIVVKALELLASSYWYDLAAGLVAVTGRRSTEILSTATFTEKSAYSVMFSGALKRRGEKVNLSFEIPTLVPAQLVIAAQLRLRESLQVSELDTPKIINDRYGAAVVKAVNYHFTGLVPPRDGEDLYTHLFRSVYGAIATHWYCPQTVAVQEFKAHIQGHFQVLEAESEELRRSYIAGRHYDDYATHDTRRGIKLDLPGVQVLQVFNHHHKEKIVTTPNLPNTLAAGPSTPAKSSLLEQHLTTLAEITLTLSSTLNCPPEGLTAYIQDITTQYHALEFQVEELSSQLNQQAKTLSVLQRQLNAQPDTTPTLIDANLNGLLLQLAQNALALVQALSPTTTTTPNPATAALTAPGATTPHTPTNPSSFPTAPLTSLTPLPTTNLPVPTTSQPTTNNPNRRNTAQDSLAKVMNAIIAFNAQTSSVQDKWAFSQSILARVSGCNQPATQKFWAIHKPQLESYNQTHGLAKSHNLSKAKRKDSTSVEHDLKPFLN